MQLTPVMFLIVCPMLFLAGLVDSIGGGGGLISLPAYLFAGLPVHMAIATNKLSSACGTTLSTARFIRKGLVNFRLAVPSVIAAVLGSSLGANLSLRVSEDVMKYVLFAVLPTAAFVVLNRHLFKDSRRHAAVADRRTLLVCLVSAFVIGMYDGFYGPGTGTFLIILFSLLAKLDVRASNGLCKAVNLTTNVTSLLVFLRGGQVLIALGLAAAVCNMLGNWLGAGMAIKSGVKITRPIIIFVLLLLLLRVAGVY